MMIECACGHLFFTVGQLVEHIEECCEYSYDDVAVVFS